LGVRIQTTTHSKHPRRRIDQRHATELGRQERCIVAAAAADLEQRLARCIAGFAQSRAVESGFLLVVLRWREKRPPCGEIVIELWHSGPYDTDRCARAIGAALDRTRPYDVLVPQHSD